MRLEREMTLPVMQWMKRQGLHLRTECATPWGICDIVGVSFRSNSVRRRIQLRQRSALGSQFDAAVLTSLPDEGTSDGVTLSTIWHALGEIASRSSIETTLDRLIHRRLVKRQRQRFVKTNGWMPLHSRIVAVELKLNRIEEVIQQAIGHAGFATESYVGLPMTPARRLARSSKFRDALAKGIGLLGVSDSGVTLLRRSSISHNATVAWLQLHMADRFWRDAHRQFNISGSTIDSGRRAAPSSAGNS